MQSHCKHEWLQVKNADLDSQSLEKCQKCGIWVSVSERIAMETLELMKGRQTRIAIIATIAALISAGAAIAK